jgi:SpoVK/Ycf46/Vps4 family AAA+-type ATPase
MNWNLYILLPVMAVVVVASAKEGHEKQGGIEEQEEQKGYRFDVDSSKYCLNIMNALIQTIQQKLENENVIPPINTLSDLIAVINTSNHPDIIPLSAILAELTLLNNMIGMSTLKESLVYQILYFIQRFHVASNDYMHTVIYGPPGTGKTEISKIIGAIYSKLGILKNNVFKKVVRDQLVAGYLGQTSMKTKEVIKSCLGGVLFIDEAYSLGTNDKVDSFAKECIDTLCDAMSEHKHELMVIIAGYEKELNECFFQHNLGLESRFVWHFKTDEYTAADLYNIFLKMIKDISWKYKFNAFVEKDIAWFEKNKAYFKYMGRDMENLLTKTKIAHSKRVFGKSLEIKQTLTLEDLEAGFRLFSNNDTVRARMEKTRIKNDILCSMFS